MTTKLNTTLLCCLCLIAWGCKTSRHSSLNSQYNSVADSSVANTKQHIISSLTTDSLNLQLIEITQSTDSIDGLTVKVARLSRSIDRMVTACDSSVSSTIKTHKQSSQKAETDDAETHTSTHRPIMLFLAISLAAFLMYLFIKK